MEPIEELRRQRVKAAWIDIGLLAAALVPFVLVGGDVDTGPDRYGFSLEGLPFLFYVTFLLAYYFGFETLLGRTPGKVLIGLEVVDRNGDRPGAARTGLRTLLRVVDWLPAFYLVGYIAVRAGGERAQRLGDLAARTSVRAVPVHAPRRGVLPSFAVVGVLVGVFVAALGATALSISAEDRFIHDADRACSKGNAALAPLEAELAQVQSLPQAAVPLSSIQTEVQSAVDDLRRLDAPPSVEAAWARFIDIADRQVILLDDLIVAAQKDDLENYRAKQAAFLELSAARASELEGLGFEECG